MSTVPSWVKAGLVSLTILMLPGLGGLFVTGYKAASAIEKNEKQDARMDGQDKRVGEVERKVDTFAALQTRSDKVLEENTKVLQQVLQKLGELEGRTKAQRTNAQPNR